MLRFLVGLFALVLSAQVIVVRHRGAPEGEPWLEGYAYRKELTIPAGAVTGDLTNFPVHVSLAGDADLAAHAQPDGSDIVFTADDKVTVLPFEVPRRVRGLIMNDGAGNWCTDPRAIKIGTKIFVSAYSKYGYPWIVSYDTATGERGASGGIFSGGTLQNDDHNQAALLELSDHRIAAFYQAHNGNAFYRISTNAADITAWGPEHNWTTAGGMLVHAYAHAFRHSGEDNKIYVLFRGGGATSDRYQHMAITTEAGLSTNTWDTIVQWLDTGKQYPYMKAVTNNVDRFWVVFSDGHPSEGSTYIRCGYHDSDGKWYKPDGTEIGTDEALPIQGTAFDLIFEGQRCWPWDIALDGDGNPVIVYAVYPGGAAGSAPDHRYRYARWTGAAWMDNEITPAGTTMAARPVAAPQQYYSGGVTLDHADPNIVYLSRNNAGGGNFVAEKWVTADNGATWTHSTVFSSGNSYRPMFAWGAASDDPWAVTWMQGDYGDFAGDFDTQIVAGSDHFETKDQGWLQDAKVKIPSITAAAGAKFYMYYGRSNPPDVSDAAGLWSAAQFVVNGNSNDAGLMYREAKSGALKYIGKYPTVLEVAGQIGRAIYFPSQGRIHLGTFDLASRRTLSIMGWVKGANGYIISNLGSDTSKAGMYLRVHPTSHKLDMWMRDSTGAAISGVFEPVVFDADTWHHIAVVFDADNGGWKAWIDGVQSPTVRSSQAFAEKASDSWDLGYCAFANQSFNGSLDELRLYPGALTEAEIKADYAAGVGTLVQVGAEEVRPKPFTN